MNIPPIDNPFKNRLERPLTAEDIEEIEEGLNMLISHLYQDDPEGLAEALEDTLPEKIDGYIGIADYALDDPHLKDMPGIEILAPGMRQLLNAVNAYYNGLN